MIILLLISFLLLVYDSIGQIDSTFHKKAYSNEFMISGGYNYSQKHFFDLGLRYYHLRNDGQTAISFAGAAVGCEFDIRDKEQIYIPYIGWQGQTFFLAYGLRAEYALSKWSQSLGFSPELGVSLIEIIRVTCGYRFVIEKNDPLNLSRFRFSIILAFPISFLKNDNN